MPAHDFHNEPIRIMLGREFREATGYYPSAAQIDDIDMTLREDILAFDKLTDWVYENDTAVQTLRRKNNR